MRCARRNLAYWNIYSFCCQMVKMTLFWTMKVLVHLAILMKDVILKFTELKNFWCSYPILIMFLKKKEKMSYMLCSCCIKVFPKCCKEVKNSHPKSFKKHLQKSYLNHMFLLKMRKLHLMKTDHPHWVIFVSFLCFSHFFFFFKSSEKA